MDIQAEKLSIIERFQQIDDTSLIQAINRLLDYWLKKQQSIIKGRISIEQYNKELEEAEKRIEKGEYITHDDLEKEAKQW